MKYRNALIIEPYIRADIGFSALLLDNDKSNRRSHNPFRKLENIWATLEIFNVIDRENTISYLFVKDFQQYCLCHAAKAHSAASQPEADYPFLRKCPNKIFIFPIRDFLIHWLTFKLLIINTYVLAGKSIYTIQINLMKSIQNLLETLKELISEATQNRSGYENMRLIPLPVKNSGKEIT